MKTLYVIDIKIYESEIVSHFPFNVVTNGKKFYTHTPEGAAFMPGYYQLYFDGPESELDALREWCGTKSWIKIIGTDTTEVPDLSDLVKVAVDQGKITAEDAVLILEQTNYLAGTKKLKETIKLKVKPDGESQ